MSAIILDGNLKSALSAVRSLGGSGVEVVCGAERKTALALHSRFVAESFVYPSPKHESDAFLSEIIMQAKKQLEKTGQMPVIFSFSDATSMLLSQAREQVSQVAIVLLPSPESFALAANKKKTYELAERLLIPTIRTYGEDEFRGIVFPVVVKGPESIRWKEGKAIAGTTQFVFDEAILREVYDKVMSESGEAPLVMEFIQGDEFGIEMVCSNGMVLAEFAHKRIRSLSPRGGAAVVKETAHEDESVKIMRMYAHALVKELLWQGPIMVEFKADRRDGKVFLMEINGRFWGSLPLAVQAGVNFPKMAYDLARGAAQKPEAFAPRSIRTRHFLGDCKWFFSVLFAKDRMRPILYPSRLRALWDFKTEIFRSKGDVLSLRDLKPSFYEYLDILSRWK